MPVCVVWDERVGLRFWLNTSLTFVYIFFPFFPYSLFVSIHFLSQLECRDETTGYLRDKPSFTYMYFLPPDDKEYSVFAIILFQIALLALASCPSICFSLSWFLYFLLHFFPAALLTPFSFCVPQSSVFYACVSFLPMYFSFCSLIYFSIFISHHLPVNLLSPYPSLQPCLLEGNVSVLQFSNILLVFNMHSPKVYNTAYNYLILPTWTFPSKWLLSDCQFRV